MSVYLIDTDWIIDALHGQATALQTLSDLAPQGLAISHLTYGELYEGAHYSRTSAVDVAVLVAFLHGIELLPTTVAIMERFAVLRGSLTVHLRRQIGDIDLIIAATALTHDLTLITRNRKDFQHVPGLQFLRQQ